MATDASARGRLTRLLRFYSSRGGEEERIAEGQFVSLAQYVGHMRAEQRAIYYLIGDELKSAARSPHLDYFRREKIEVLFLVDPLDGFMLAGLTEYEGFPLKNVDDAGLDLPAARSGREKAAEAEADAAPPAEFEALIAHAKERLGERVTDVRASDRLVDSPARLVSPEDAKGRDMDRVRRLIEKDYTIPKKIMELNRRHPLVKNLAALLAAGQSEALALVGECIEQLYENSLLLEGLHPNPAEMVGRIQALMEAATKAS